MRRTAFLLTLLAALVIPDAAAALDPQVAGLQVALRARGVYRGPVDGILGPETRRAVRVFQQRAGLEVDGVAGPRTRRALGRLGRPLFGKRLVRPGAAGWDVSVVQFLLVRHGFPVVLDGEYGTQTGQALRRFQSWAGLTRDGVVGPATRRALVESPSSGRFRARVLAALRYWSRREGIDFRLARAVAAAESGYRPDAVSSRGAWGVMQVTLPTWSFVEDRLLGEVPYTPAGNIRVGLAYLHYLLHEFDGNARLALAAYNQGPASVRERGILAETRAYVATVLALQKRYPARAIAAAT